jgi:hypothetical protein
VCLNYFQQFRQRVEKHRQNRIQCLQKEANPAAPKKLVDIFLGSKQVGIELELFGAISPWDELIRSLNLFIPPLSH